MQMIARPKLEERLIFPPLKREMRRRISGNDSNYNLIQHRNLTSAVSDCHPFHFSLQIEKGKKSAPLNADSIVNIEHTQNMVAPQQFQIFCKLLDTKKSQESSGNKTLTGWKCVFPNLLSYFMYAS